MAQLPQVSTRLSPRSPHPQRYWDICRSGRLVLLNRGECSPRCSQHSSFVLVEQENIQTKWMLQYKQIIRLRREEQQEKGSSLFVEQKQAYFKVTAGQFQMLEAPLPLLHIPWLNTCSLIKKGEWGLVLHSNISHASTTWLRIAAEFFVLHSGLRLRLKLWFLSFFKLP